ncbi:type II secretion system F family protein [Hyunsoonleella pacifica]|uniref:General secretion pathway protein F n=1 Tax=Hyunsoonleella pacifica TaxID=1080224 RepID=A0A4Q9FKH0_9FLAO|nr:type II secretion system F family protein [Hyunsoonleella pacifica]TBN11966.1 type II secretion system F family protein [Hyunsoonleella pacifica]GGD07654.1 general secretion pathway protein GspF [Hyunsoonleella pacifica]
MKIDAVTYNKSKKKDTLKFDTNVSMPLLKRFTDKQKEDFYREFSTLIKSGVDFNKALLILTNQQKSKFVKSIYKKINADVVKGKSLNEAIKNYKYFSSYEYYSIKIGEDTRRLSEIFDQLQKFFSRKIKMKRQVVSVLAYPVFVLFITFAVLYFMLNFVVPMFASVFQQFGKDLPEITQFVVSISNNFNTILFVVLGICLVFYTSHKLLKANTKYQDIKSKIVLKLPYFGNLIRKIYLARFCQSFSLLLSAKTPLITSLELTEKMISFYPLKSAISKAKKDVMKGESLSESLKQSSFFTPKIISLTSIGEEINELDTMYDGLANQYNEEVDHATKMIGTILEPLMIVVIGGIVGFIMIAMYSPIFNLSKVIES